MAARLFICLAVCSTTLWTAGSAWAATTHQVFNLIAPPYNIYGSKEVGFRYFNATNGTGGPGSDGALTFTRDSVEWAALRGKSAAFKNEARFVFRGSGVDIRYLEDSLGENMSWEVVDGGAEGSFNVVASGNVDTFGAVQTLKTATAAAQGTLDPSKLHILRVWVNDTDASSAKRVMWLDAFDVHDEVPFARNENNSGYWQYTNWDSKHDAESNASGATTALLGKASTNNAGSSVEFSFVGTSLVVNGYQQSGVNSVYQWSIDGGLGGSGTVDQSLDDDFAIRWPELLVNGLSPGKHTLKITASGDGNLGAFGANSGYTQLDAFDIIGTAVPEPASVLIVCVALTPLVVMRRRK